MELPPRPLSCRHLTPDTPKLATQSGYTSSNTSRVTSTRLNLPPQLVPAANTRTATVDLTRLSNYQVQRRRARDKYARRASAGR